MLGAETHCVYVVLNSLQLLYEEKLEQRLVNFHLAILKHYH